MRNEHMKKERGAITILTLTTVLFMLAFLISTYVIITNRRQVQEEIKKETKNIYQANVENVNQVYEELIDNARRVCEHEWEEWTVVKETTDIQSGEKNRRCKLCGKLQTLTGITGYYAKLKNSDGKNLTDYKIYGNSIQNGTPTANTPIQIQSVGEYDEGIGKYKIPIQISGSNKIDFTKFKPYGSGKITFLENGLEYNGSYYISINCSSLKSGQTYYMCWDYEGDDAITPAWRIEYSDNTYSNMIQNGTGITIPSGKNVKNILIYLEESEIIHKTKLTNIMLSEETSTAYEPYRETKSYNIYLEEPLRKVGDYQDYIDFENKKVVRNIANEFIEKVEFISTNSGTYKIFLSNISHKPFLTYASTTSLTPPYSVGHTISNKFQQSIYRYGGLTSHANLIQTYITTGNVNRIAYTFDDSSITTIEQAQEKIGDGFEVCYVLETPNDTEAIELPTIQTYEGTTIIEIGTEIKPSKIEIK